MRIEKKEIDALTAELTLVIEKDDYLNDYNDQLKTYRQKASMKGFRKGKTPLGMVKKMYGSSAMQEAVSKVLGNKINDIITGDEYQIIGEPLFLDEDNVPIIDHNDPQEYSYRFEIGMEPEFEVKGASDGDTYSQFNVIVSEEMINEEVEELKKKFGSQEDVDDKIVENDVVYFAAKELDGKKLREGGVETEFSSSVKSLVDKYQKQLLESKVGDSIDFDIFQFEKDLSEENVYKYFLKKKSQQKMKQRLVICSKGKLFALLEVSLQNSTKSFLTSTLGKTL